jgi:hypothetical protein
MLECHVGRECRQEYVRLIEEATVIVSWYPLVGEFTVP